MKITSIEPQVKIKDRFSIFIDREFSFGVYADTILRYKLKPGDEANEDLITEIKKFDEVEFGKKAAYKFLSYKARTETEVRRKLQRLKLLQESIDAVISRLSELDLLNDEKYSRTFVEERTKIKPIGRRMITAKLNRAGVSRNIYEPVVSRISNETELNNALKLLSKYIKNRVFKDINDKKSKCFRFLSSKGFEFDVIKQVLSEFAL